MLQFVLKVFWISRWISTGTLILFPSAYIATDWATRLLVTPRKNTQESVSRDSNMRVPGCEASSSHWPRCTQRTDSSSHYPAHFNAVFLDKLPPDQETTCI